MTTKTLKTKKKTKHWKAWYLLTKPKCETTSGNKRMCKKNTKDTVTCYKNEFSKKKNQTTK